MYMRMHCHSFTPVQSMFHTHYYMMQCDKGGYSQVDLFGLPILWEFKVLSLNIQLHLLAL